MPQHIQQPINIKKTATMLHARRSVAFPMFPLSFDLLSFICTQLQFTSLRADNRLDVACCGITGFRL
ncbi:MAG: hypothetical protein DMG79_04670 [Acidobacteria bacterium]|nr:MAG: hypothetical protein DMG79_04670 [Acidobacteriota bacterium]